MLNAYQLNTIISYSTISFVFLFLAALVYFNNTKNPINITFSLYSISIFSWSFISIFMINATSEEFATFYDRLCLSGAIFIPTTFLHFILHYLNHRLNQKNFIKYFYAISLLLLAINTTHYFVPYTAPVHHLKYFTVPGIGYYLFLTHYTITAGLALYFILNCLLLENSKTKKAQLIYLFYGTLLAYIGGSLNFCLVLRIPLYDLVPYGNYFVSLYGIIVAYAIIKHKLLNITILIKRGIVYSCLISAITVLYISFIYIAEKAFQGLVGYKSIAISVASATTIAIIFTPLKFLIQSLIDKLFFKGTLIQISKENQLLHNEVALKEKFRVISTLASGIAHEVKNPLTSLKTFTEYLPKKLDDKEFLLKFSNIVGSEVDRIDDLVQQLLDYGKPAPLSLRKVNIVKLLNDTIDIFNNNFLEKNIKVIKTYKDTSVIFINIDPTQIRQSFMNILLNAIESMEHSEVLTIDIIQTSESKVHLSFKDTGIGICKTDLTRIFEPFFTKKDKGTGLGLSITKTIIDNHKGRIYAKSDGKKGSEFIIELPLKPKL